MYTPYGAASKIGTDDSTFQFTGRENDGAAGLYYYRTRYYSPALERFISEDSIGLAGGFNLYAYVGGDPISYTDPEGETLNRADFPEDFNLREDGVYGNSKAIFIRGP